MISALKRGAGVTVMMGDILLLLFGRDVPPAAAWEGKKDNKAPEDLARMSDAELCAEALAVCLYSAQPGEGRGMEGLDYLTVIRQAAQKKYGERGPSWLEEVATAIAKHAPEQCPSATCTALQGE